MARKSMGRSLSLGGCQLRQSQINHTHTTLNKRQVHPISHSKRMGKENLSSLSIIEVQVKILFQ